MQGENMEINPLVLLARCGLFLPHYTASISEATKKSFSIRSANESDIDRLEIIECECWGNLKLSRERILTRVRNHPSSQWVCVVNEEVVAVLYTQRLNSIQTLMQPNTTFAMQEKIHSTEDSSVIQLLGVAVLSEYAHLQMGTALRDFVLQLAHQDKSVTSVVAMTRCSSATLLKNSTTDIHSLEQAYLEKVRTGADPTLKFHISGGAKVIAAVPNYRPEDKLNFGYAVLIKYDIREPVNDAGTRCDAAAAAEMLRRTAGEISVDQIRLLLLETIENKDAIDAVRAMSSVDMLSTPFMNLGLQSLEMVEMRSRLQTLAPNATLSPTLLFDFPTPRALLEELNRDSAPAEAVRADTGGGSAERATTSIPSTSATSSSRGPQEESEHVMYAICAMSCRLPGDISSPDAFHQALLNKTHTVSQVPASYKWDSKTQHASFLNDDLAESFDPAYFKINAVEAQQMDPHQRLLLEVGYEALVSAAALHGTAQQTSEAPHVGVFVGLCNNEWVHSSGDAALGPYSTTGSAQSAAANRLSFLLGLTGPSMVVDTACSSSLAALHTALNALKCGDCEVALVAAADLLVSSHSLKVCNLRFV